MKPPGRYRIRVHRERVDPILWQAPVTDVKTVLSRLMVARVRGEPTGPHVAQLGASLRAERLVRR